MFILYFDYDGFLVQFFMFTILLNFYVTIFVIIFVVFCVIIVHFTFLLKNLSYLKFYNFVLSIMLSFFTQSRLSRLQCRLKVKIPIICWIVFKIGITVQNMQMDVRCLQTTVHCLLSTVHCPQSTIHSLLFNVHCMSTVCSPLSTIHCPLSTVRLPCFSCLLSVV